MRKKTYAVALTAAERERLQDLIAAGTAPARRLAHARILLKAGQGPGGPAWVDERITGAREISQPAVSWVRKQYVEEGLQDSRRPWTGAPPAGYMSASWRERKKHG